MQKRYYPITVITIALALVAVIGYMSPSATQAEPIRVLFDNKGGKVIFSHKAHVEDYGAECTACHHDFKDAPGEDGEVQPLTGDPLPCGTCHVAAYDKAFKTDHIAVFEALGNEAYCERCHHEGYDGKDSEACSECHEEKLEELIPPRMAGFHNSCMGCHKEMGAGPYQDTDCKFCHLR